MPRLPDAQRLHVGDIRITVLSDGPLPLGVEQLKGIDEPEYARLLRLRHADPQTWRSGLNAFVIETGDRKVLVDAGVGTASDAAVAMELGCDGVLMNTAIAEAKDPVRMAQAMKLAVEAGRHAYLSGRMGTRKYADPSSPLAGLI